MYLFFLGGGGVKLMIMEDIESSPAQDFASPSLPNDDTESWKECNISPKTAPALVRARTQCKN